MSENKYAVVSILSRTAIALALIGGLAYAAGLENKRRKEVAAAAEPDLGKGIGDLAEREVCQKSGDLPGGRELFACFFPADFRFQPRGTPDHRCWIVVEHWADRSSLSCYPTYESFWARGEGLEESAPPAEEGGELQSFRGWTDRLAAGRK